jgi:hypothetical protein
VAKVKVRDKDGPVISSGTASGEVEDGTSGAPECARRSALFWKETAAGGRTEEVDVEVSRMVGAIVWAEGSSRVAAVAAGSGEVAESWKFSVAV